MQTEASIATPGPEYSPGLCVLVAEDNEADAYLICRALARQPRVGKVVHVPDGVTALWMVEHGEITPDLAFVDLHMPGIGGLGLLVAFAERPQPGFPVVVVTSSSAPLDATRSRMRGAFRVISKPDSIEALEFELSSAITAACSRRPSANNGGMPRAAFHGVPSTPYLIALEEELDQLWTTPAPTPSA
jgi:CheY-like chemotaxis protein